MAPEILDIRQYGKEADLWSCGAIFLELIVGNLPWQNAKSRPEIADLKKKFFYKFSNGSVNLESMGINISPLYLNFLT
jgi:serine/threonine protein kinase